MPDISIEVQLMDEYEDEWSYNNGDVENLETIKSLDMTR